MFDVPVHEEDLLYKLRKNFPFDRGIEQKSHHGAKTVGNEIVNIGRAFAEKSTLHDLERTSVENANDECEKFCILFQCRCALLQQQAAREQQHQHKKYPGMNELIELQQLKKRDVREVAPGNRA